MKTAVSMMLLVSVLVSCPAMTACALAADDAVANALMSAFSKTTHSFQGRYSQSRYYNENGGCVVDAASGYSRHPGKVTIYNRTEETITVPLLGSIPPRSVTMDEFYARVLGATITGSETSKEYGSVTLEPTTNGIIFVVTSDGVEQR